MLNKCFPCVNLEFWYMLGMECLCDQLAIKTLSAESLMSFLVDNISRMLSQFVAGGTKHVLCDSTGRELLEACAVLGFFEICPIHLSFC